MHAENSSACAWIFACWAGLGAWPPLGMYFPHAFSPFGNAGLFGSIPLPEVIVTLPSEDGSGKFGPPCLRMHDANFAMSLPPLRVKPLRAPPPPPLAPPPDEDA